MDRSRNEMAHKLGSNGIMNPSGNSLEDVAKFVEEYIEKGNKKASQEWLY